MLLVKMEERAVVQKINECWLWGSWKNPDGYGDIGPMHKLVPRRVHRLVYEATFNKIPDGMQIDHLCKVRSCINPFHLEVVSLKENVLRGVGITAINARKSHCKRNHPLSGSNLFYSNGTRQCSACRRIRGKKYYYLNHEKMKMISRNYQRNKRRR